MTGNKLNIDLSYGLKGSYTVEGAIIIPIFIVMLAIAMKMGLVPVSYTHLFLNFLYFLI